MKRTVNKEEFYSMSREEYLERIDKKRQELDIVHNLWKELTNPRMVPYINKRGQKRIIDLEYQESRLRDSIDAYARVVASMESEK